MAKKYGNRWENCNRDIGAGGQGVILRVRDLADPLQQEYALKRLKDTKRIERFRLEIDALQRINHPNIVKIVDYSVDEDGPWFVLPIAQANLESRVNLYKGNLDAVVEVALQLAQALEAAHAKNIIHRDVKPANILFPRVDHELWLSDFGICHDSHGDRLTGFGEVIGPRHFTAPELELRGQNEVTPAADIYSLGKVIFYMLSGGTIIAREDFDVDSFDKEFAKSERYKLLGILLSRMIAVSDQRIQNARDVLSGLRQIRDWEQHACTLALSDDVVASINAMQVKAIENSQIQKQNQISLEQSRKEVANTAASIAAWIEGELKKTSSLIAGSGHFEVLIGPRSWGKGDPFSYVYPDGRERFSSVSAVEMAMMHLTGHQRSKFVLTFFICNKQSRHVQIGPTPQRLPLIAPELSVVPYIVELSAPSYEKWHLGGFIRFAGVPISQRGGISLISETSIAKTFAGEPLNLLVRFKSSEWPASLEQIKPMFSKSVQTLIEFSQLMVRSTGA